MNRFSIAPCPSLSSRRLVTASFWLSLATALNLGTIACSSNSPSAPPTVGNAQTAQIPDPAKTDPALPKLVGQWQPKQSPGGIPQPTLWFAPEGKLYLVQALQSGKQSAVAMSYAIDSSKTPIQLDLSVPGEPKTVQTILEITADGLLRLETSSNPGDPRPTKFTADAILFRRISEQAELPADVTVLDAGAEAAKARQSEAKTYIGTMARSQQAYFLEKSQFSSTIEPLGLGLNPETENYTYRIVSQTPKQVVMTAQAKKPDLKSFASVVIVTNEANSKSSSSAAAMTQALICETEQPSTTVPTIADTFNTAADLKCPSGSQKLN